MALINEQDLNTAQNKVFYYQQSLTSKGFNRVFSKTLPVGIYEGGEFTRINDNQFSIAPFSVVIEDREDADVAVRIRTTDTLIATIENDISLPLIVARFSWIDGSERYLEVLQVSESEGTGDSELNSKDLILGKLNLLDTSGTISIMTNNSFDYTRKSKSLFTKDILKDNFLVRSAKSSEDNTKVYIESGQLRVKDGLLNLVGTSSPSLSTTTFNRIDYIYIDETGSIQVEEGDISGNSKPYYGRKVIAEIRRESGRDTILGSEIYNIPDVDLGTQKADTFLIDNSNAYFSGSNITIEEALDQSWEKTTEEIVEEHKIFRSSSGTQFDVGLNKDAIIVKGRDTGTLGRTMTITTSSVLTANRTLNLPNGDVNILAGTQLTIANTDQSIDGIKTFINNIVIPTTPTISTHAASKNYVDLVDIDLANHKNNSITSSNNVHGIQQGTGNGFDADKLDGADKSTLTSLGTSDSLIPTQKAVKTYVDTTDTNIKSWVQNTATSLKAQTLSTSRALNGEGFDGSSSITVPTNLTINNTTNAEHYVTFVADNSNGNKSLKQSSKMSFNPSTGRLTISTFNITSSRTKKDNIEIYKKKATDIINNSEICSFTYKDDDTKETHIGIIAEDAPIEMVSKERNSFALSDTVGLLLKAVQELSQRITELENKEN